MEHQKNTTEVSPQFQEIFGLQFKLTRKEGRPVSISEAIAIWIAFGYAEQFRHDHFNTLQ